MNAASAAGLMDALPWLFIAATWQRSCPSMAYRQHLRQRRMPPVKVELLTVNQPDQMQAAEGIQSMVAEAGFDLRIQAIEFASSLQASQRGDYELYLIGWSGRVGNVSHYSNPAVDKLLEDGRALTDVAKRRPIYARCSRNCAATCR